MALVRWPLPASTRFWGHRGIGWGVTRSPAYATIVREAPDTGRQSAISRRTRSVDDITLAWWGRDDFSVVSNAVRTFPATEARILLSFFRARRGRAEPFAWMDPTDKKVTTQVISAATPAIGADPLNPDSRNYQVVRTLGSTGVVEPVDYINTGLDDEAVPAVFDDAAPVTFVANFPKDGWVRLDAAPTAGSVLTFTGSYYSRVAFREDDLEYEIFAYNFLQAKKIHLRTRRW